MRIQTSSVEQACKLKKNWKHLSFKAWVKLVKRSKEFLILLRTNLSYWFRKRILSKSSSRCSITFMRFAKNYQLTQKYSFEQVYAFVNFLLRALIMKLQYDFWKEFDYTRWTKMSLTSQSKYWEILDILSFYLKNLMSLSLHTSECLNWLGRKMTTQTNLKFTRS